MGKQLIKKNAYSIMIFAVEKNRPENEPDQEKTKVADSERNTLLAKYHRQVERTVATLERFGLKVYRRP